MRRNIGKGSLSFLLVLCGLLLGSRASAQTQSPIITIDAPGATRGTVATAINASGVIAGYYFASDGTHGFVRNLDGTFVSFDSPLGPSAGQIVPMSINNAGVITGFYNDPNFGSFGNGAVHGFIRKPDSTFTTFDAPIDPSNPTPGTLPYSIDSAGQIAGRYWICNIQDNPCTDGFLRQPDGTIATFAAPNGQGSTWTQGIDAAGAVAGYFVDLTNFTEHGFLRAPDATFTVIDVPGAPPGTAITAINARGETAGTFLNTQCSNHGFLRSPNGTFTVFDVPAACSGCFQVAGVNDAGTVAGTFQDGIDDSTQVFLRFADGTFTNFSPGNRSGYALVAGINSSNSVVGTYQDANGAPHGYLRSGNAGN